MRQTLLALYAHPDDESFACGGSLARYAHQGVRIVLACATRGEAGIVVKNPAASCDLGRDEMGWRSEDMGRVREEELRCACRVLGIEVLRFLDYRDSGMEEDSPDQDHPQAFVRADPDEVVGKILDLFREFRPQVVLTFGPSGSSGHPDHIAIHRHTTAAWRAIDAGCCPDLAADPPRKLYYVARSRERYRRLYDMVWQRGLLPAPLSEEQIQRRGVPSERITTHISVDDFIPAKLQALRCHCTQVAADNLYMRLPEDLRRQFLAVETYTLVAARGLEVIPGETDLFAGLS